MSAHLIHVRSTATGIWVVHPDGLDTPLSEHTNETEAERLAVLQPMLPFGDDLNTVHTPSISAIRAIGPSAPSRSSAAEASANAAASGE
jgi:hypothetical protein